MNCKTCKWPSPETCKVCKQDILRVSAAKLTTLAQDPNGLARIISLAYNQGIAIGHLKADRAYNQMFRDYNKVTLEN